MKLQNIVCLFTGLLGFCTAGCAHKIYDPSLPPEASADKVQAVSLEAKPPKPIAPNPWRVTMKVKNIGCEPLDNVHYLFLIGGKGEQLGEGCIPHLNPGQTANVVSDVAKVEQGFYHVEGRVFLQKPNAEPEFKDRINNWLIKTVVVAQ